MCPGSLSNIGCCVLNPTSPLQPKKDYPPEPVLSLMGSSDIAMLQDPWPVLQDDSVLFSEPWLNEVDIIPPDSLQAGTQPGQDFSLISNPPVDSLAETISNLNDFHELPAIGSGLFDVASLPATSANDFTASLDESQHLPNELSSNEPLFAVALV